MVQFKLIAILLLTFSFSVFVSGLLWWIVSIPLTALLVWILTYFGFEQLPEERLHKFAGMFGLAQASGSDGADRGSSPASGEVPLHRIVMHRGGNVNVSNSGAKQGVAGVEIDLQFTVDGVGILLHDDTLDRTTDATGDVRNKCFADLEGVNAAAKHKYGNGKGAVKIPTLEECLQECLRLNLVVFIDCKAFADKTADLVDELFRKYPDLYDNAVVCSFYPNIIYTMRRKNSRVITALTFRRMSMSCQVDCVTPLFKGLKHYLYTCLDYVNMWLMYAWAWRFCGNSFLLLNKESMCRNEQNWWKALGIRLMIWTVNSDIEKQFCLDHLQVPIITDGLGRLQDLEACLRRRRVFKCFVRGITQEYIPEPSVSQQH